MESIPFEIAHCSSFEQDYEPDHLIIASSLDNSQDPFQNVSHRGWQTKRFPDYPQDLILQFKSGLCRISKIQILSHHYKIASQIELYIGITKEQEQDSMYIQFTRLGFVSLDNNNRFQDRELKSIKIQADCEYVRLVIKGCHENRLNVHKQVGFLALNILGQPIVDEIQDDNSASVEEHYALLNNKQQQQAALSHNTNVDFNLEHWIQVIQNAEEESAQDEDFKEAKIYKELGERLTGLWRFLINLENDKQQAVTTKDYDEADKIKADMIQVRETAESLLKQSGIQITRDGDILPYEDIPYTTSSDDEEEEEGEYVEYEQVVAESIIPDIQSIKETALASESKLNHQSSISGHPDKLLDEAIANWTSFDALSINNNYKNSSNNSSAEVVSSPSLLSARIPVNKAESNNAPPTAIVAEKQAPVEDPELIPEPLSSDDLESCQLSIEIFGQNFVACIMSVKIKCRQKGLKQLLELIKQQQQTLDLEFIQASLLMIQEAVTDSRESIFNQAIQAWKELHDLILNNKEVKLTFGWIEKLFSRILIRTSDNSPGIKSTATKTILDLIDTYPALIPLCMKERMIRNMKDAKARVELVTLVTRKAIVPQWKTDTTFYRKDVLTFISTYVKKHPHADVRQVTWDLLVVIAQEQDIKIVSTFLEADTIKALQQELKKTEKKRLIKSSTSTTVNELRALTVKSNNSNTMKKPKQQDERKKITGTNGNTASSKKNNKAAEKMQQETIAEEEEEEEKTNVCIFCDEENPDFNEDTLISHYYNNCPVLTNCPMCQIILEVSTLKDHLKSDCERKHLVKQCTNCKDYIPIEQWLQHSKKKTCVATAKHQSRCPFCQKDMTRSTEASWKSHLLTQCPRNPRMALNAAK